MESIAQEVISTYVGPLMNPSLLLAAALTVAVLVSGLGAKIIELGQAATQAVTNRAVGAGPSPLLPNLMVHEAQSGGRT